MPFSIFFSAAVLLPVALAIPVPQVISTGLTSPSGRPTGVASLGGLSSTITLGDSPINNLPYNGGGNSPPPCQPWQSSCYNYPGNGGGGYNNYPNNGYGNNNNGYGNNNNNGYEQYQPRPCAPWDSNCRGYDEPYNPNGNSPAPGGEAGTAVVSTSGDGINSSFGKRDIPTTKPGYGSSQGRKGHPASGSSSTGQSTAVGPANGGTGVAGLGGLASGISFGPKEKRQFEDAATDSNDDASSILSGLESALGLGGNENGEVSSETSWDY